MSKTFQRYCPKCGNVTLSQRDENCHFCGEKYLFTKYTMDDIFNGTGTDKIIFNEYIKDNPEFDEELYAQREGKEKILQQASLDKQMSANKVTCPYCKSTNVSKISTLGRSISVGLFGLASGKVGKQWHCNGCKSDF